MIQFVLAFSLGLSANAADSKTSPQEIAADIAESIYFSAKYSGTFGQWLKNLNLPPATAKDVQAYLTGHHLENTAVPQFRWKPGTSQIKTPTMLLDFAGVPEHRSFTIDGKKLSIEGKQIFFGEIIQRIQDARRTTTKVSSWILSNVEPTAAAEDLSDTLSAALDYVNLAKQWGLCQGIESGKKHECWVYPDWNMIQEDIGKGSKISQFTCSNGKFQKLSYASPENSDNTHYNQISISAEYDSKGNLQKVSTAKDRHACNYSITNENISDITPAIPDDQPYCQGRTYADDDDQYQAHHLKIGDRVRNYGENPVPFDRLQRCCADKQCPYQVLGKVPPVDDGPTPVPFGVEGTGVP